MVSDLQVSADGMAALASLRAVGHPSSAARRQFHVRVAAMGIAASFLVAAGDRSTTLRVAPV